MNTSLHGKEISWIVLKDGTPLHSSTAQKLSFSGTYHGDRDEFWVVLSDPDGVETGRYQASQLQAIFWK